MPEQQYGEYQGTYPTLILFTKALHDAQVDLTTPQRKLLEQCWQVFAKEDIQWVKAHSINVASIAHAMATAYTSQQFTSEELGEIALAGLLHDIGKTHTKFYPNLNKNGLLTEKERIEIQKHADYGRDMEIMIGIPERIYQLSAPHHEILQKDPYPRTNGDQTYEGKDRRTPVDPKLQCGQKLIAIADQIEAAMSPLRPRDPTHPPKTAKEVFEFLRANEHLEEFPDAILQVGINRCLALQQKQRVLSGAALYEGSSKAK